MCDLNSFVIVITFHADTSDTHVTLKVTTVHTANPFLIRKQLAVVCDLCQGRYILKKVYERLFPIHSHYNLKQEYDIFKLISYISILNNQ